MDNSTKVVHISAPVRMRTQAQALAEVKALDPNTALTAHALRKLILQKKIKVVIAGNKYLLNFDSLLEYLANPVSSTEEPHEVKGYGKLRPVGR